MERFLACQFQICMWQKVVATDCFVGASICCERDVFHIFFLNNATLVIITVAVMKQC